MNLVYKINLQQLSSTYRQKNNSLQSTLKQDFTKDKGPVSPNLELTLNAQ